MMDIKAADNAIFKWIVKAAIVTVVGIGLAISMKLTSLLFTIPAVIYLRLTMPPEMSEEVVGRRGRIRAALRARNDRFDVIAGLLEAVRLGSEEERVQARTKLRNLLARFPASCEEHLGNGLQLDLIDYLHRESSADAELAGALFGALKRLGSQPALEALLKLGSDAEFMATMDMAALKEYERAVGAIRFRARAAEDRDILLRSTTAVEEGTLLHPVDSAQAEQNDEVLLRPTSE